MQELKGRHIVMLSGGWDSAYCAVVARKKNYSGRVICCFFEYGQSYLEPERMASAAVCEALGLVRKVVEIPELSVDENDVFKNRNEIFLAHLASFSPASIYFGCRNPFALFDRFGDSNWQWARRMENRYDVRIITPCVLRPKWWIQRTVLRRGVSSKSVYSTEV